MTTAMTRLSPVVHALRVCGFSDVGRVAAFLGQPEEDAAEVLRELEKAGLARYRGGRVAGWLLTPEARADHESRLRAELDGASWENEVLACYGEFLDLNVELKETCTDWQLKYGEGERIPNDHRDETYDARVIVRLAELHECAAPMIRRLGTVLSRFGPYLPRLESALARLRDGDKSAFARPMSASYHCVWMELHEDLLVTLARERDVADGH